MGIDINMGVRIVISRILRRNLKLKSRRYNAICTLLKAESGIIAPIIANGIPKPSLPTNTANSSRPTIIAPHKSKESTKLAIKATSVASCFSLSLSNSCCTRNFWNPASASISAKDITIIIVANIPNAVGASIWANIIFVSGVISFAKTSVMTDHLAAATILVSIIFY